MSLIKQNYVKNHRTEIHVAQPESQSDPTGFSHEESAGPDPKVNDSVVNPLNIPTPSEPESAPIIISRSVRA